MRSVALAVLVLALAGAARGYEFEISARTAGEAYSVRWYRFSERDRLLNRRRLTQTLGLEIWQPPDEPSSLPFAVSFSGQLRVEHDFGEFTGGDIIYPSGNGTTRDPATRVVPELGADDFAAEVLWAVVGLRGIAGVIDVDLGRQLVVDALDWYAFDGARLALRLPLHLALEAHAGFLVRDSSPAGGSTHEPDGTSDAQCLAFAADVGAYAASPDCAQRDAVAPTFGVAIATRGLRDLSARLSYRRTISATAAGVYPDARGEAPAWGVLEEKLGAEVRASLAGGALVPWAAARWNLLVGAIDEAHAGLRLGLGAHALSLEALYSDPTFDGDSIFNVFSIEPYWDARATIDLWPGRGPLRGYLRGFHRRFHDASSTGAGAGARLLGGRGSARLDLFYEDGYGGLRAGGDLAGAWRLVRQLAVEGRASLVRFEEDSIANLRATTVGVQGGAVWTLGPGMALHFIAEENSNRFDRSQLRLLAILDLAFQPEH